MIQKTVIGRVIKLLLVNIGAEFGMITNSTMTTRHAVTIITALLIINVIGALLLIRELLK